MNRSWPAAVRLRRWLFSRWSGLALLVGLFGLVASWSSVSAILATVVPDSTNATLNSGWLTTDSSMWAAVDEGATPDGQHIYAPTSGGGGEVVHLGFGPVANVETASQVKIHTCAYSSTNANGGTLDSLSLQVTLNSTTDVGAPQNFSPAYSSTSGCTWYSYTLAVNWTSADVTNFGVKYTRAVQGSGNPAGQVDDVRIGSVYAEVTYVAATSLAQSAYRWFENQDLTQKQVLIGALGAPTRDSAGAMIETSTGDYVMAGFTDNAGLGSLDTMLTKYDADRQVIWSKSWGGSSNESLRDVIEADGGYVAVGNTSSFGAGGADGLIIKYDSDGQPAWNKVIGGTGGEFFESVVEVPGEGYVITGWTNGYGAGGSDMIIIKIDLTGQPLWTATWGGSGNERGNGVIRTADGGFAVACQTTNPSEACLVKYSSTGAVDWARTWGNNGTSAEIFESVTELSDGSLVAVGATNSYGSGGQDAAVVKFSSTGSVLWDRTWGSVGLEVANGAITTSGDQIVITGETASYGAGQSDVSIFQFDASGNNNWSRTWGGAGVEYGSDIALTVDGGFIVSGETEGFGAGGEEAFFIKTDSLGDTTDCGSSCSSVSGATTAAFAGTLTPAMTTTNPAMTTTNASASQVSAELTETQITIIPSVAVGNPLAAQDTGIVSPADGSPFRLRLNLHVDTAEAAVGSSDFRLQYAARGGDGVCDPSFSSETYYDVTTSSPVAYFDNPEAVNGQATMISIDDPAHAGHTNVSQSYVEQNNFSIKNDIAVGSDGVWDFALRLVNAPSSTNYCLRVVESSGSLLNAYGVIPELSTPEPRFGQMDYRWFTNTDAAAAGEYKAEASGLSSNDDVQDVVATADGGYAVAGFSGNFGSGQDAFVAKYDASGVFLWATGISSTGPSDEKAYGITEAADGSLYITGCFADETSAFVAKLNSSGNAQWLRGWYGGAACGNGLAVDAAGDIVMVGRTDGFGSGGDDALMVKVSPSGSLVWDRVWGGAGYEAAWNIITDSSGNYVVVGDTSDSFSTGGLEGFITKFTSSGTLSWTSILAGGDDTRPYGDGLNDVVEAPDGDYVALGDSNAYAPGGSNDMMVAKYDSTSGSQLWASTWGGSAYEYGTDIIVTNDSGLAAVGYGSSFGGSGYTTTLVKMNSSGGHEWSRVFASDGSDYGRGLHQEADGDYVLLGSTSSSMGAGSSDVLLVFYDSSGNIQGCSASQCLASGANFSPTTSSPSPTHLSPGVTMLDPGANFSNPLYNQSTGSFTTTSLTPPSVGVGAALAAQNTAPTVDPGQTVRLRQLVQLSSGTTSIGKQFKLQFGERQTTCAAVSYSDISTGGISFYDNPIASDGLALISSANDPQPAAGTVVNQSYSEDISIEISSALATGQYGLWDFALTSDTSVAGKTICFRVVHGDGTPLDTYDSYATIKFSGGVEPGPASAIERQLRGGQTVIDGVKTPFSW